MRPKKEKNLLELIKFQLRIEQPQATKAMQERLEFLIEKSKSGAITIEEKDELDHYLVLERLVRLAKIRVQRRLLEA